MNLILSKSLLSIALRNPNLCYNQRYDAIFPQYPFTWPACRAAFLAPQHHGSSAVGAAARFCLQFSCDA